MDVAKPRLLAGIRALAPSGEGEQGDRYGKKHHLGDFDGLSLWGETCRGRFTLGRGGPGLPLGLGACWVEKAQGGSPVVLEAGGEEEATQGEVG